MITNNKVTEIFNITQECGDFLIVKFKNALRITTNKFSFALLSFYFLITSQKQIDKNMRTNIIINSNKGEVQAFDGDVQVGQINFNIADGVLSIEHTGVVEGFERKGIAGILVQAATDYAVHHNLKIKAVCSYAQHWYKHNRQYKNILIEQE